MASCVIARGIEPIPAALAPLLGLQDARKYNARNIAAYTAQVATRRDELLWGTGITGADLKSGGFTVFMKKVPPTVGEWDTAPFEAQYLKIYDVTAPENTPTTPVMPNNHDYEIGTQATFDWDDVSADSEGIVPYYEVTVIINSGNPTTYITTESQFTVSASEGQQVSISVRAVNPNDPKSKGPTSSQSQAIKLLSANGDEDSDGKTNADEKTAGTNPRDVNSRLEVIESTVNLSDKFTLTWNSVLGITYGVQSKEDLTALMWDIEEEDIEGTGSAIVWVDTDVINPMTLANKFYRVIVEQ